MSITAINCTPIKPKVSFGESNHEAEYSKVVNQAMDIRDSFTPQNGDNKGIKSVVGTAISLAAAAVVTYAGGKFVAAKLTDLFPKAANKLSAGLVKLADSKASANVANFLAGKKGKVAEGATKVFNGAVDGLKKPEALKNIAAGAALAFGLGKIATVDGNNDGIKDITQKHVNAYKSAMENMGIFSEIISAIS